MADYFATYSMGGTTGVVNIKYYFGIESYDVANLKATVKFWATASIHSKNTRTGRGVLFKSSRGGVGTYININGTTYNYADNDFEPWITTSQQKTNCFYLPSSTLNTGEEVVIPGYEGVFTVSYSGYGTTTTFNAEHSFSYAYDDSSYSYEREGYSSSDGVASKITVPALPAEAKLLTASNFTDETNPTITYSNVAGNSVSALEACISLTGGVDDIAYRSISKTGSSYTFALTDAEKNVLRAAAASTTSITVRFYVRTTIGGTRYFSYLDRTFTVVNCNPVISNMVVKDISSATLALTGNENVIVNGMSMVEYSYAVAAMKQATITTYSITSGEKTVKDMTQGVIDDVESGLFIFSATDSRGLTTTQTLQKQEVNYVRPTCYQKPHAELVGETGARVVLNVNGNYFSGSFGKVSNTMKVEVRYTQADGTMGPWTDVSAQLTKQTFKDNTYEIQVIFSGFTYDRSYTFQTRITDKLLTVESAQYTVRVLPIFDWSNSDFNFNVPVAMSNETVLRYNETARNLVVSAGGGHIYIRPGGTNDTSSEIKITPQGNLELKGDIIINGVNLITALENAGII